ncbi:MAG: tetratricopeptide repeat protein [Desulfuromonas sp.]
MKRIERWLACAMILVLAGCASLQPVATEPPPPPRNEAVIALLDVSRSQSSAGKLDMAGASLERALRIEPQNPELWQELARVRLQQRQYREAENFAAKANILAGTDMHLRAENWRIIGQARTSLGDYQGAQAAFEHAEGE